MYIDVFQHHRAISSFPNWVINDCKNSNPESFKKIVKSVVADSNVVYSNLDYFKKYKDSKVLFVAGGPSSKETEWSTEGYDYIWSCNHFFRHPRLKDLKVDLAMIMPEVDLQSEEFLQYRQKHNPYYGFEIHDKWVAHAFDDYERYFCMHTRFYSKIGIGARMLIFAGALGCKEVSFIGLDGPIYQIKGNHGFETGKNSFPSCYHGVSQEVILKSYLDQHKLLWEHINNFYPNTAYKNLGYGEEQHAFIKNKGFKE
tara:strand:+ start:13293 stop:14060 length:768 start_codon:yes stop_codon:yes gene_type:complete